jgi:hypothetical protein
MRRVLSLLAFATALVCAQQDQIPIGEIDFFGYAGLEVAKVRAALPVHEGDVFSYAETTRQQIEAAVRGVIGQAPTDVAAVCCDAHQHFMIYIGLPGLSQKPLAYNPAPRGSVRLPAGAARLYKQTMEAWEQAVLKGVSAEDDSAGYALSVDQNLRARQLAMRRYAVAHDKLLEQVLESSASAADRKAAAALLGYANRSKEQIAALVRASRDPAGAVRNNSVRALSVLAASSGATGPQIPAQNFIAMLNSGQWTDRNKAGWLLTELTQSRSPQVLAELRSQALPALMEMAQWHNPGHAGPTEFCWEGSRELRKTVSSNSPGRARWTRSSRR